MSIPTECPRGTAWCTDHQHDADQCVSFSLGAGSTNIWLVQEIAGLEPSIAVDATGQVTLTEASDLSDAIAQLRQAALFGTQVEP